MVQPSSIKVKHVICVCVEVSTICTLTVLIQRHLPITVATCGFKSPMLNSQGVVRPVKQV